MPEHCLACGKQLIDGELVLFDVSGDYIHDACCGPEPECYVVYEADGDHRPLLPGEVIPKGFPYESDPHEDKDVPEAGQVVVRKDH